MKSKGIARMTNVTWVVVIRFLLAFTLVVSLFPTLPLAAKAEEIAEDEVKATEIAETETPVAKIEEVSSVDEIESPEIDEQEELFKASMLEDNSSNDSDMPFIAISNKVKATPFYAASDIATGNLRSITAQADVVDSGNIYGADWSLDSSGVLTIGNGSAQSLTIPRGTSISPSTWPWYSYRDSITSVVVRGNVSASGCLSYLFYNLRKCTQMNLAGLNTAEVTFMSSMFQNCSSLMSLGVSGFNTSNVTTMREMFSNCSNLNYLNVSNFNTANVTDMNLMFYNCKKLTSLNVTNFNTQKVTNMKGMFRNCSMSSLNLGNFNTSKTTNMSDMFQACSKLTSLDLSNFDTSSVTNMNNMFYGCSSLTSLNVSNFNTSNVTNMGFMFYGCPRLTSLNLSSFNTSNVINMSGMFQTCPQLASLDLSNFDTSNVTNISFMFQGCSQLTSLDLSNFNTPNVTNMNNMFYECSQLTSLDISSFNTSNVVNMSGMFYKCSNLTFLDVSDFDTSKVTNMGSMFYECSSLVVIYASPSFSTDTATLSSNMFFRCTSLIGGVGTVYDSSHLDKEYARIDSASTPGYFTDANPTKAREVTVIPGENATFMLSNPSYTLGTLEISLDGIETANIPNAYWSLDGENWFSASRTDGVYTLSATSGNGGAALFTDYGAYEIHWKVDATEDGYSEATGAFNFTIDPYIADEITPPNLEFAGYKWYVTGGTTDPSKLSTYDEYVFAGDYGAVTPGTYNCTVTPAPGCAWNDGTRATIALTWSISEHSSTPVDYWYVKDRVLHIEYGEFASTIANSLGADNWPEDHPSSGYPMCSTKFVTGSLPGNTAYSNVKSKVAWDKAVIEPSHANSPTNIGKFAFYKCSNMQSIEGLQNASPGTTTASMFVDCSQLEEVDLTGFDMSNVTTTNRMFQGCASLRKVTFDESGINKSVGTVNMTEMFKNCESLVEVDMSMFICKPAAGGYDLFYNCCNLESIDISGLDNTATTRLTWFTGCTSLKTLILGQNFKFNGRGITSQTYMLNLPGEYWYNSSVDNPILVSREDMVNGEYSGQMQGIWKRKDSYTHKMVDGSTLRTGTNAQYNNFRAKLHFASGHSSLSGQNYKIKNVTIVSGTHFVDGLDLSDDSLFEELPIMSSYSKEALSDFSYYNDGSIKLRLIKNATSDSYFDAYIYSDGQIVLDNCDSLFYEFRALNKVTFINIDCSGNTTTSNMFRGTSLRSLEEINTRLVGSSCTDISSMFNGTYIDSGLPSISNWDTSNVENMKSTFAYTGSVGFNSNLDFSSWDTSNVTNMSMMFYHCNVEELNLSSWDTSNVGDFNDMFDSCYYLTYLDLSNFTFKDVTVVPPAFPSYIREVKLGDDWRFGSGLSDDGQAYATTNVPKIINRDGESYTSWEKIGEQGEYSPAEFAALKTPVNGYDYSGAWRVVGYSSGDNDGNYTVNFDANGGSGYIVSSVIMPHNEFASLPNINVSRPGYRFDGWNTKEDGSGVTYKPGTQVRNLANIGETITLYARWSEDRFTVSVPAVVKWNNKNAGLVNEHLSSTISVDGSFPGYLSVYGDESYMTCIGQTDTILLSPDSYNNSLLFETPGSEQDVVNLNGIAKVGVYEGEVHYSVAHHKTTEYYLCYDLNGGSISENEPMSYTNPEEVTFVSPTRDGYNFAGWTWDGQMTPVMSLPSGIAGDLQLIAFWEAA